MKPHAILTVFVLTIVLSTAGAARAQNIDPTNDGSQYAWGENVGRINFQPAFGPGVTVTDAAVTGLAWGENIGWVNLSPTTGGGVVNDGAGRLSGYAWGENIGWINFAPTGGGVSINACGDFNGTAWGENIGWISFRSSGAFPHKVTTSWVPSIDATTPVTSATGPGSGWNRTDVGVTLSATDCGSGVGELHYTLDSDPEVVINGSSVSVSITSDGIHSLSYFSVDTAGNREPAHVVSIRIDKTAPVITVSSPADGAMFLLNQNVAADFAVTDSVSGMAVLTSTVVNGSPIATATPGVGSFSVTAFDEAGNSTSVTHTYSVLLPARPPQILSSGHHHTLTLAIDGTLWAWGNNSNGQLGVDPGAQNPAPQSCVGSTNPCSPLPFEVHGLPNVIALAGGAAHTVALTQDGRVWAWGSNGEGQLGDGTTLERYVPVPVIDPAGGFLRGVVAIAAGGFHTLALKNDGTVWTWGRNDRAQLGTGAADGPDVCGPAFCSTAPAQVRLPGAAGFLSGIVAIAGGFQHSAAVGSDGSAWTWGVNNAGQLGAASGEICSGVPCSSTSVLVGGPSGTVNGVVAVAAGLNHTIALKNDGTVWTWGQNNYGQLGHGGAIGPELCGADPCSTSPRQVGGLSGVAAIAGGANHTIALKDDGTVWTWGWNDSGQLAFRGPTNSGFGEGMGPAICGINLDRQANCSDRPVQAFGPGGVGVLDRIVAIAAGNIHTVALRNDGTLWAWGNRSLFRQTGDGSNPSPPYRLEPGMVGVASLHVTPVGPSIGVGQTQQFIATATLSEDFTDDITHLVSWSSSDPAVAPINITTFGEVREGLTSGVSPGATTITARSFNHSVDTTLSVGAVNHAPVANAGPDRIIEAVSASGAITTLDGSASFDPDGDALIFTWTGPFGTASGATPAATLPLGTSTVTLTVDDGQAVAMDTVAITVRDTAPPTISCPQNIFVQAAPVSGVIVNYPLPATADAVDPAPALLHSQASGTVFPIGATTVTVTATDASGNTATCGFIVTVSPDVIVGDTTPQSVLDGLTDVPGSVTTESTGRSTLVVPNLTSVGNRVVVANNPALVTADVSVNGPIRGDVEVRGNRSASTVRIRARDGIGGNLVLVENGSAATTVETPRIDGSVTISDGASNTIQLGEVGSVGGSVVIADGSSNTVVFGEVDSVGGDVTIGRNTSAGSPIVTGRIRRVVGNVAIVDNSVTIADGSPNTIVLGEIESVEGDLTVSGNTSTRGASNLDVSNTIVLGEVIIVTDGSTRVSGSTGGSGTSVTLINGSATMNVLLPEDAFATNVPFTIESLGSAGSLTGPIVDGSSNTINVAELAAYRFTFGVATLDQDATLAFDIDIAGLDAASQSALFAAVASNSATLALQGDAPDSLAQVFPVCATGEEPTAGGCVQVLRLDAIGNVVPAGAFAVATIRFVAVTGHFSTFAVVIATPIPDTVPPVISNMPESIVAVATSPAGAVVTYAPPTALDDRDGAVAVSCTPSPGSTFPTGITTVTCEAADAAGNSSSGSFTVTVKPRGADLSITNTDSPDPVTLGSPLTYTITVANNGPSQAMDVWVVHTLRGRVRFVSAAASRGRCFEIFGLVVCNLHTLADGGTAIVTIVVVPKAKGTLSSTANVWSPMRDPEPANNQATTTTLAR